MRFGYSKRFIKQLTKLKRAEQNRFAERLELFKNNPRHAGLRNHALTDRYQGFRSINVGGDLRAVFDVGPKEMIVFIAIGTHSQLYE
jgi:addiction module RelE/StbE family toxin